MSCELSILSREIVKFQQKCVENWVGQSASPPLADELMFYVAKKRGQGVNKNENIITYC
jgi:uncharacterized iron-regulated protein